MNAGQSEVEQFSAFIRRAREVAAAEEERDTQAFRSFLDRTRDLLVPALQPTAERLAQGFRAVEALLLPHDVLDVAGLTWREDPYTELIAWILTPRPTDDYGVALAVQRAWLRHLGIPGAEMVDQPARPVTQLHTGHDRPDLVLRYPHLVVVVEAKTGSGEHETPFGEMQTLSYPETVAAHLDLPPGTNVECVLLTLDGSRPANPKAKSASYLDFVFVAAEEIDRLDPPAGSKHCYATILTHFFHRAVPDGVDLEAFRLPFLECAQSRGAAEAGRKYINQLAALNFLVRGKEK